MTIADRLAALSEKGTAGIDLAAASQVVHAGRTGRRRQRMALALLAGIAIAATTGAVVLRPGPAHRTALTAAPPVVSTLIPLPHLASIAEQQAVAAGDPRPTSAEVVRTDLGEVQRQVGETITAMPLYELQPVYEVVLQGNFRCQAVCFGANPVTGSALVLAADVTTLHIDTFGLTNTPPDLALIGPVYSLLLPDSSSQPAIRPPPRAVSPTSVEKAALRDSRCPVPAHLDGSRDILPLIPGRTACTSVSVRFFPTFAAAAAALPGLVEPGRFVADPLRPLYYTTVHGQLPFTCLCPGPVPPYADHDNGFYDALTGAGQGGGTAGTPLP